MAPEVQGRVLRWMFHSLSTWQNNIKHSGGCRSSKGLNSRIKGRSRSEVFASTVTRFPRCPWLPRLFTRIKATTVCRLLSRRLTFGRFPYFAVLSKLQKTHEVLIAVPPRSCIPALTWRWRGERMMKMEAEWRGNVRSRNVHKERLAKNKAERRDGGSDKCGWCQLELSSYRSREKRSTASHLPAINWSMGNPYYSFCLAGCGYGLDTAGPREVIGCTLLQ